MLPEIHLDTEQFEEIAREMQNMIAGVYPEWTDYNIHDPGITLLELFAWLQEIQQYHMDQISEGQLKQYLALLGTHCHKRKAARVLLSVHSSNPVTIRKNSRFFAGNYCFETERELKLPGSCLEVCACEEKGSMISLDRQQLLYEGKMEFYPFGSHLIPGTVCYLGLDAPLIPGKETGLFIRIRENGKAKRNRIQGDFRPLSDLAYEYYENDMSGWQPLTVIRDGSYGFLQDGFLRITCSRPMELTEIAGYPVYGIRIVLKDSGYELPPVIEGIDIGCVQAVQRRTRARMTVGNLTLKEHGAEITAALLAEGEQADCCLRFGNRYQIVQAEVQREEERLVYFVLGDFQEKSPDGAFLLIYEKGFEQGRWLAQGDGFPYQRKTLEDGQILSDGFVLLAEDPEAPDFFNLWKQVDDFHSSGPEDRHYILDGEKGELIFGDGFNGRMPEGRLLIAKYAVSAGKEGNINPIEFTSPEYPEISAVSRRTAGGGEDPESCEEAFQRFERSQNNTSQAVTLSDYERLAMRTPGLLLRSCRAFVSADETVTVSVMPYSEHGVGILSSGAALNIRRFLEKRRMIGTRIRVKSPEYIHISVTVQLYLKPQYRNGQQMAEAVIRSFFESIYGQMGKILSYRGLCGSLERLACVARLGYLTIEARGSGFTYGENGDIVPPLDGVFLLKDLECVILEV